MLLRLSSASKGTAYTYALCSGPLFWLVAVFLYTFAVTTMETVVLWAATAFVGILCPVLMTRWTLHILCAQKYSDMNVFLLQSMPGPSVELLLLFWC